MIGKRFTGCLLSFAAVLSAGAQTPAETLAKFKKKYPGEQVVILDYRSEMHISFKKGKWQIYTDFYQEIMYLSKNASTFSSKDIQYSQTFDRLEMKEAYTLVPGEKDYKKVSVDRFNYSDVQDEDIFHDDVKSVGFYFPAVDEGCKTVVRYRMYDLEPHLLGKLNMYFLIPTENVSIKIHTDPNVSLELKKFNMEKSIAKYSEIKDKHGMVYSYEMLAQPKFEHEEDQPAPSYIYPHVVPLIRYGIKGKDTFHVLQNTHDLANWLQEMYNRCDRSEDADLKNVTDSLTAGVTDTIEKINRIYQWVHRNIRYIAFEDGLSGYVPFPAVEVYKHRYGDCKGMSNIIYTMLKHAGIEAYLTTIGTVDIPYKVEELHSPMLFNHMIVSVKYRGNYYFLDGTSDYTPYNFVPEGIQNKECIAFSSSNSFKVLTTPIMDYRLNYLTDSVHLSWTGKGNELKGNGFTVSEGYYKQHEQQILNFLKNDKEHFDDFVKSRYSRGNNKCVLDTAWFDNMESLTEPMYSHFQFHIGDLAKSVGDELYVNPHLIKPYANDEIKAERKYPVKRNFHAVLRVVSVIDIPTGYGVDYLPKNLQQSNSRLAVNISYSQVGNQIICVQEYVEKNLMIENSYFTDWNNIIKKVSKSYNEVIVFKKLH